MYFYYTENILNSIKIKTEAPGEGGLTATVNRDDRHKICEIRRKKIKKYLAARGNLKLWGFNL